MSTPVISSTYSLYPLTTGGQLFFKKITLTTAQLRTLTSGITIIPQVLGKAIVLCQPVYTHGVATTQFTTASDLRIKDSTTGIVHCTITSQALTTLPLSGSLDHRMSEQGTSTGYNTNIGSYYIIDSSANPTEGAGTSDLVLTLYLFYYYIEDRT